MFQCSNLLSLQSQLNEDLLQFLVDKVDAELLKAVFLPGRGEKNSGHGSSDHPRGKSKLTAP